MGVFTDKVVIVTGGASGIGKALSERLAREGACVVLSDIDEEGANRTVEGIQRSGGQASGERLDVTDYEAFEKHISDAAATHGRLDYLFNNAGIAIAGELRDLEVEHWRKVIDVDLNGVFYGSLVAYKRMVKQGFGHIVNLSSVEGLAPFPANAPYVAAKYAVLGFTQTLWVEGRHFGVKASAVCPGYIKTPIFDVSPVINLDRQKIKDRYKGLEWLGVTPEKCAEVILKGVAADKPVIPVTGFAHVFWGLARLGPVALMKYVRRDFDGWRDEVRTES